MTRCRRPEARRNEQIYVEFSTRQLAGLGVDRAALIAALQAQNADIPAGSLQTGNEKLSIRVTGAFKSENDLLDVNFVSNGRLIRLRGIAEVCRSLSDPPQPMFQVNGKPAIQSRKRQFTGLGLCDGPGNAIPHAVVPYGAAA
jgi:multidrug efflux pump subunit AcrB